MVRPVCWRLASAVWALLALIVAGCAAHEPGRFQIKSLTIKGQQDLAARPLTECLVSRQRPHFGLTVGLAQPSCGEPPFSSSAPRVNLWVWWWKDWPAFNRAVFEEDLKRIERWYRARGYYEARVAEVTYDPPEARNPGEETSCDLEHDVCKVKITVTVEEGPPTLVHEVLFEGLEELPEKLRHTILRVGRLEEAEPIDEALYELAKERISRELRETGYARPIVAGTVEVDTTARRAKVTFRVAAGRLYTFGKVSVTGHGSLPEKPILAAGQVRPGRRYAPEVVREVHAEVYALGAFSSVEVREVPDETTGRMDLRLEVTPQEPHALRLGVGVSSGAKQRTSTGELASIPQWDVHLFGRYERRHVFGTLGRLTLEERPRVIFSDDFPRPTPPQLGNLVGLKLTQPGLLEARTELFSENAWDFGPDAFLGFERSDLFFRIGARRGFFSRRLLATLALQQDLFLVNPSGVTSDGSELPSSYGYSFVEQDVRLDLRDNSLRPRIGAYFGLNASQAPRWSGSDWTALRLAPDARVYLPLIFDIVWASRIAMGGIFITDASSSLDATSQALGPNTYRLRGGGANSNRGFLAGQLGAGRQGGIRRWEASTELRVPFGQDFVLAGFADIGDVNDAPDWRFDHLNLSVGLGLRFYTILGAIRLDLGLRIPSLQRTDGSDGVEPDDSRFLGNPGALHLTIGDAF